MVVHREGGRVCYFLRPTGGYLIYFRFVRISLFSDFFFDKLEETLVELKLNSYCIHLTFMAKLLALF